jgi:anaerobic C4-dicarboxylate transporter
MNRMLSICIPAVLVSCSLHAQTVDKQIKKLAKDPKTSENAAKADVYTAKKDAKIYDTTVITNKNATSKKEEQPVKKKKSSKKSSSR